MVTKHNQFRSMMLVMSIVVSVLAGLKKTLPLQRSVSSFRIGQLGYHQFQLKTVFSVNRDLA